MQLILNAKLDVGSERVKTNALMYIAKIIDIRNVRVYILLRNSLLK